MSVRELPAREARSAKSLPKVVNQEAISNVCTMLDNFQTTSVQYLKLLIGDRLIHTARIPHDSTMPSEIDDKNAKLSQTRNESEIEKFLLKTDARCSQEFPLYLISEQIQMICNPKAHLGLKLCFSAFVRAFGVFCDFLLNEENLTMHKHDKKLANQAIDILMKAKLPPLFYPDVDSHILMSVDFGDITPVSPTAITATESTLYVGCKGPVIKAIPLLRTQKKEITHIEIPDIPDEPFSLVTHNGVLVLSSANEPPLHIDPNQKAFMKLQVSHYRHVPMVVPKFGPPVVTDGEFFYSIGYSEAKVKIFKLEMDGIFFVSSIKLTAQKDQLMAPFKEVLPATQRKKCSIATNGIYIGFLFREPEITICRIFLLRNGTHQHDVVMNGAGDIDSWCFDGFRPAHCVMRKGKVMFLDGRYTLPRWLVGFEEPLENPKVNSGKPEEVVLALSQALTLFAARIIGTEVELPICLNNQYYKNSMEQCFCKFIDSNNRYAAQALLVLLDVKMSQGDTDLYPANFIGRLFECYDDPKSEYLRRHIVFTVLSALDNLYQANPDLTSKMLMKIIHSKEYINILCKYLPRSQFLLKALSQESLKALCGLTLKTTFMYDEEAISLMKEIQYSFVARGDFSSQSLFQLYVRELCSQLEEDYSHVLKDEWSHQRFSSSVSFILFNELVQLARAAGDKQPLNPELALRLFIVGSMPNPVLSPDTEAICKMFTQSLFVSLLLYINLINNDTNFYVFGGDTRKWAVTGKSQCLAIDSAAISPELREAVLETVDLCCCENVSKDDMIDSVYEVFHLVLRGEATEEEVIDRCKIINSIQPQLFKNAFRFLIEGGECKVIDDSSECSSAQFLKIFDQPFSDRMKATMLFFLDDINEIRQHFMILPEEYVTRWLESCDLRFSFPTCLFPPSFKIKARWINEMSFEKLESCIDNVLSLADRIEDFELLRAEITPTEIYSVSVREELLRKLMVLSVAGRRSFECATKYDTLFQQCVQIGDYRVACQSITVLKELLGHQNYDGSRHLLFLFRTVGGFLSGTSNIFLVQKDSLISYRIVLMICDFFRELGGKNHPQFKSLIRSTLENEMMPQDYVAVFAIFNTSITAVDGALLRCSTEPSKTSQGFAGALEDFIIEIAPILKKSILEFEDVNAFKYACLCELIQLTQFRELFTFKEIELLCKDARRDDRGIDVLLRALSDTWSIVFPLMPLFSFDTNETPWEESGLIELNIFGEERPTEISDMLTTEEREHTFTSTMVSPHAFSELQLENHSARKIQIVLHAGCDKCGFVSSEFEISAHGSIKVLPKQRIVEVVNDEQKTNVIVPPRCDVLYYSMDLEASSVVHYTFTSDCHYEKPISCGDGVLMRRDDELENVPFRMGLQWKLCFIQETHSNLSRFFMVKILQKYFSRPFVVTTDNCETLSKIIVDALNSIDPNPFSCCCVLSDYPLCAMADEHTFVSTFIETVKQNDEQRVMFIDSLTKLIHNSVTTTVSANNSSALVGCDLRNDILTDCCYATDTDFSFEMLQGNKVFMIPMNDISGTCLDSVRTLKHAMTLMFELSSSYQDLCNSLSIIKSLIEPLKAGESLKDLITKVLPASRHEASGIENLIINSCPDLFADKKVFFDCSYPLFMFTRANPKLFHVSFALLNSLFSPSCTTCVETSEPVVHFETNSSGQVFLYIDCSGDVLFEMSSSSDFSENVKTITPNTPVIVPLMSFYVRAKSHDFDISTVKFYWKVFELDISDIERIRHDISLWTSVDSNTLLLTFPHDSVLSHEKWQLSPLSARFSLNTGILFHDTLAHLSKSDEVRFFRDHVMCYDLALLSSDETRLERFRLLFPEFSTASMLEVLFERGLTELEKAGVLALTFGKSIEVPFNVTYQFCRSLSNRKCPTGSVFHAVLGVDAASILSPLFIRSQACYTPITRGDLEPMFLFQNERPSMKDTLFWAIDNIPPYTLNLFVEWITGVWGLCALRSSPLPCIVVRFCDTPNYIDRHADSHLLTMGTFTSPNEFATAIVGKICDYIVK